MGKVAKVTLSALTFAVVPFLAGWWAAEARQVDEMKYNAGRLQIIEAQNHALAKSCKAAMDLAEDDMRLALWYVEQVKRRTKNGNVERLQHAGR